MISRTDWASSVTFSVGRMQPAEACSIPLPLLPLPLHRVEWGRPRYGEVMAFVDLGRGSRFC